MTRDEAYQLVRERLGESATLAHCLACEACMDALATHFGEDQQLWGLAGLVHDLDLDECGDDMARHALVGARVLEARGAPEEVVQAVLGHNDKAERTTKMAKALWVVDPTTGFITAAALIRPSKSTRDLTVKSIKKRMKDKRFAAKVNREEIRKGAEELGVDFDEHVLFVVAAMSGVAEQLGLNP